MRRSEEVVCTLLFPPEVIHRERLEGQEVRAMDKAAHKACLSYPSGSGSGLRLRLP